MPGATPSKSNDISLAYASPGVGTGSAVKLDPEIRQFVGYENLGVLGVGGMGVVYRARQLALNRIVAIKTLRHHEQAAPHELERFRVEAEIVAQFQHPNIVQLYHLGEHEGQPFLAFEYVEGGSLAKIIAGQPQPCREAAALIETLAHAVHAAHLRGVVHRDLTPNNVLLAADGTPRIADFGLAQMQERIGSFAVGIAGTASYMSPEQAWGDVPGKAIGPATDVYGLGAILYELLCGRPPFKASTSQQTLAMVYNDPPKPPRDLVPHIPRDLETICLRCLEKDPQQRFSSAEALADELRRFLAGKPITCRSVGTGEQLWLWSRRNPMIATMAAVLVFMLVASVVLVTNKMLADQRAAVAEQQQADALYRNQFLVARHAWESGDVGRAIQFLEACSRQRRSLEWFVLRSQCQSQQRKLSWSGEAIGALAYSPNGQVLVASEDVDAVRLIDVASGKVLHELRGHDFRLAPPRFSPDGKWLASVGKSDAAYWIRVWDVASGEEVQKLGPLAGVGVSVQFSPSGNELISLALDNPLSSPQLLCQW
jgi:tRNA A-37 threonylcarbamoyl transferase component Bud32